MSGTRPRDDRPLRIVAIADTDSYVKWAAALLGPVPGAELIVLNTELVVSDGQLESALNGSGFAGSGRVRRAEYGELSSLLRGADAVLLAARGPLVRVLARLVASVEPRPVIVTGLPGISVPATWLALHFRRECDLFVLHSHREIGEFVELAAERGLDQLFALATLPFARSAARSAHGDRGTDLVFAAQAIVPPTRVERLRVARLLVRAAEADPSRRVVLKLRGRPGEAETHRELAPYPALLEEITPVRPANLVVSTEPMSVALERAQGLVTVSSTAAIEAAASGVPVIALDAFGVSPTLINVVFEGSGLFGSEDDVVARRFRAPSPGWLDGNYFHDPEDDDWMPLLAALVERRRRGGLEPRRPPRPLGGRARDAWERRLALGREDRSVGGMAAYAVGLPLRALVRGVRRVRNRLTEDRSTATDPTAPTSRAS